MNFLNTLCLGRYIGAVSWCANCCRIPSIQVDLIPRSKEPKHRTNKEVTESKAKDTLHSKMCKKHLCLVSRSILLTQVRYYCEKKCDQYPRFHHDLDPPNFDAYRKDQFVNVRKTKWGQMDDKVGYSYLFGFIGWLGAMYGTKSVATYFVSSMAAAADVRASAQIEVDISNVVEGQCMSLKWRGKPLFIKHRSAADITSEADTSLSVLKDPQTPEQRTPIKPEWLVVIGICTHLGCVPIPNSGDYPGGFYCPCHGSHYDNIGRARKGPAPLNLEIPPYSFVSDTVILVG